MKDRMQTQRDEFDAVAELAKQYRRLTMTLIVDDDYPEIRHDYEGALQTLIKALEANGRLPTVKRVAGEFIPKLQYLVDSWPEKLEDDGITFPDGSFWPKST